MSGRITPSSSLENSQQNDLSVVLAAPAMLQQARRVSEVSHPPVLLAQSLLSTLPPGSIPGFSVSEVEDPFVEDDDGVERHGPRGAAAAASVFASRVQTSSSSSSSSSSSAAQAQNAWEGIPDDFKDKLTRVVTEIEILSNDVQRSSENANSKLIESPRLEKLKLTKRMKDYSVNVMKYVGKDAVLDLVIKYIICFNKITLKQMELKKDKNTGRSPQFFHEVFKGWVDRIQTKLSEAQLEKFNKTAVDPYSEAVVQRESLKDSLIALKACFDGLLDRARSVEEGAPGNEKKIVSARKSRFVDRMNQLEKRIALYESDSEIMDLAGQIRMKIHEVSEWQSTTQRKSKSGATMGIRDSSALRPELTHLISTTKPKDLSSVSKRDPILKRIDSVVNELTHFIEENSAVFNMDKKSLAQPENLGEALKLRNSCKTNKVDLVGKRLADYFKSPKDEDLAEIASSVDQLASAFNALGEFQSKCPKAKQIKYFYATYTTFAEKLRPFLPAHSAVFASSPGPNTKQIIGQKPRSVAPEKTVKAVRSKKPVVESESESSESESSSSSSRSSSSSSESSSESSDSSSERSVVVAPRRGRASLKRPSSGTEVSASKRRRLELSPRVDLADATAMELVEEPPAVPTLAEQMMNSLPPQLLPPSMAPQMQAIPAAVSAAPPIRTLSLEERHKDLLGRLQRAKKLVPGFSVKSVMTEEELALDKLDFYDLHFKKTYREKIAIVSAHVEKLKNLLGEVWRSNETMSQKRAFICQIAKALNEVIWRMSQEFGEIEDLVAGFAETLNPLLVDDIELRALLGNKSFSMLFPTFTNYCIKKGDVTLLRRIFSQREAELLSL